MEVVAIAVVVVVVYFIYRASRTAKLNNDPYQIQLASMMVEHVSGSPSVSEEDIDNFLRELHEQGIHPNVSKRIAHATSLVLHVGNTDPELAKAVRDFAREKAKQFPI